MVTPATETRQPGIWALVIVIVIALALTTVHAREGDSGPVHTVRRGAQAVAGPVAYAGDVLTLPFRATYAWLSGFTVSQAEVAELREQNAQLRARTAQLEEAAAENERLRALVGFADAAGLEAQGANVIGRPTTSWEGVIVLDVGSEDGIERSMPVLSAQGLVGQVVEVSLGSCRVRLLTDPRGGAAALVQRTRATGVVRGSGERVLTLDFVDRAAIPKPGDVVLTSGLGGVYPKGLVIGEVDEVDLRLNDLYPRIVVASQVPFDSLEQVLVLTTAPPPVEGGAVE